MKRVFLIVLDSVGIGEMPDASSYGDAGSNTLATVSASEYFDVPNMQTLGLFNIDGVKCGKPSENPEGSFARMQEASKGKDTTIGHWEISGIISDSPLPTFKNGFPQEIILEYERLTGRKVLCNKPYSGTKLLEDYGEESVKTGSLIVYTSADSVFQVAAHEEVIPLQELYSYCDMARKLLKGKNAVGRVIARPFVGSFSKYKRTKNRRDLSLEPPGITMLDQLKDNGKSVIGVGKIHDIFAGKGITEFVKTSSNADGIEKTIEYQKKDFEGLCFVNLVDFDMLYGHRNDIDGYAKGLTYFDEQLPRMISNLRSDDILMITADHGCDPGSASTDHSREYTPWIIYADNIQKGLNLGTLPTFSDIGSTILDYFEIEGKIRGTSRLKNLFT